MDSGNAALVIAAGQAGTPAWVTPVIAGAAAILAATVTALASAYAAKRKVAELRLSNSFDLAKQYLESARNYTETVYMPLSISVHELQSEFLAYKTQIEATQATEADEDRFREACSKFIKTSDDLFLRGAGAVLTIRLDEAISRFASFLRESLSLTSGKVVKTRKIPSADTQLQLATKMLKSIPLMLIPFATAHIMFSMLPDIILEFRVIISAAPLDSKAFEEQFSEYVDFVKVGIKEVTLGGYKN